MANRFLSNIRINDAYTLPASDGSSGQVITTDGSGNLSFVDPTSGAATTALSLNVTVKNVSGGSLSKGTIIHAHPSANPPSGNVIEVIAADYDDTTKMPAIGVLNETLANEAEGQAIMFGAVSGIDTSGFSIGDELWVGNNGAFTNTKPATAGQLIQKIAVVIKSHATAGLIKVFGAGRTNDVPLPLYIDNTNQRVGIGISTPAVPLHVNGWARLNGSLQLDGSNRQVMAIDNTSLLFGTDNTVRMTITNVGKVGIALTSPESKLDVFESSTNQKAFKATDGTSWVSFVPTLGSGGYNGISSAGDIGLIFSIDNDNTTNSTTNGLVIAPHAQATSGLKILENGYVGIGDSTPLYSLHVESTDDTLALFKSTDNKASIRVADDDTSAYVSAENGRASFGHYIGANSNNLNINSSGNVSIGTTSASDKLTVAGDVNVSGALKGPSTFYIDPSPDDTGEPGGATTDTGTVVILGDLQVTGTTTTIDSTTLNIGDLNIVLAKDATTAAAANGAGITINGANATMTYDSTNDRFNFNKAIASSTHVTSGANVYSGTSGQFRNYAGVWTATTGVSGNGFSFISADGTAMTISSTGDISASGATFDSNVNIRKNNVGIITTYSSASIEATDAQLDIISSASGTWGSSINLVEGASSTANTNVWSIARQTSGVGNLLRFNFGTVNQHDNAQMFSISTGGNATAQGSVSATVFYDVTNTAYYVNPDNTGTSANFAGKVQASQVGVTNIVTNKVVKFNGSILDDSNITDTGSLITLNSQATVSGDLTINPSTNYALYIGRMAGQPNIKSSDAYALMDSNGGYAALNWYTTDNVGLAVGGGKVSIGTSTIAQKLHVNGDVGATVYYDKDNTNRYVNPSDAGRSIHVEGYITAGIGDSKGFEIGAGGAHISAVGLGDVVFQGANQLRFGPSNWDWNQWGGIKYTGGASPILYIGGPASSVFSSNSAPPSTEINFTGTTFVMSDTSFRAPIFYDSNDTSYYVHPDNLSHLNIVRVPGDIRGNGQQLILNAGESAAYATGQTGENVYVNAENGLQVNSSPDNWGSGWAGRKTTTINDALGNSYFANNIYVPDQILHTGDTDTYMQFNAADTWRVVVGGSQKLVVNSSSVSVSNATLSHQGVTLSSGDNIDQIHTFAMSFTLTALTWTDTGISHTDLPTGTYTVQVYVDDHNAGGQHYDEYYSGTMSWYAGSTNSTNSDEIVLHNAGHASGSSYIQLRTERHTNTTGTHLMLQVKQNFNHSTALDGTDGKTMTFKFRRLL